MKNNDSKQQPELSEYSIADNLVDLYWFLQVVDAGSFSTLINQKGLSKSSLSRRISQLESRLGVQLLYRNPRFLTLTHIGAEVYRYAQDMVNAAQQAQRSVERARSIPSGTIHIVLPAILNHWLMPVLRSFKNIHTDIQLSIHAADNTAETAMQAIDLALSLSTPPNNSSDIVARPIAQLSFVNVISSSIKNTEHAPQIEVCDSHNATPTTHSMQVDSHLSALQAAQAGFGFAHLPLCACSSGLSSGDLKYINHVSEQRTLFAFTQPRRSITLATRTLLDYLVLSIADNTVTGIAPVTSTSRNYQQ
ncbi:MAG: LysR family transcriptional regulator [Gammaproteobacteria bacterium]|nr:LysR family transcriptional regulator [Gammaproteobacteria bacterium]